MFEIDLFLLNLKYSSSKPACFKKCLLWLCWMKQEYRCHGYPSRISGEGTFTQVLNFHSSHAELRVSSLDFVSADRLFPPADSQQTQHLSSYQLTVPRPIGGRLRRDAEGRPPSQVSEVSTVSGCISLWRSLLRVAHCASPQETLRQHRVC